VKSTQRPRLFIVSQPTWGVDVGAAAQIRGEILALRDAGCAVLVVSEELDELFELCDRLHVMARGRLSPCHRGGRGYGDANWGVDERLVAGSDVQEPRWRRWRPHAQARSPATTIELAGPTARRCWRWLVHRGDRRAAVHAAGQRPGRRAAVFFWEPIRSRYALGELAVKATPLLLIALGLAVLLPLQRAGTSAPKAST